MQIDHERVLEIGTLLDRLTITHFYRNGFYIFAFLVKRHFSVGAKLKYMGYFASLLHPPGRKSWLLFSVRDMSGGLRNPCFTKFSVVRFLSWPVINVTPQTLKIAVYKIQD